MSAKSRFGKKAERIPVTIDLEDGDGPFIVDVQLATIRDYNAATKFAGAKLDGVGADDARLTASLAATCAFEHGTNDKVFDSPEAVLDLSLEHAARLGPIVEAAMSAVAKKK